jgi:tricorn protease
MFVKAIVFFAFLFLLFSAPAAAQTKLLRFPDVHADRVVFSYGSDLWTVGSSGGQAVRLTAHPGVEVFAKFSPDGKYIAFTGQYDGDEQVYVMPATGGEPKQLTFYPAKGPLTPRWGYDNQVMGWSNDGSSIIFRSQRDSWTLPQSRLYSILMTGGAPVALPMPEAGSGDFSPDGTKMVYSPRTRDFRTEKRYGGGQANTLYIYDLNTADARKISKACAPRAMRCGSALKFITILTATGNSIFTFTTFRAEKQRKRRTSKIGKFAGLRPTIKTASFTSETANWRFSTRNRINRRN